MNAAGWIVLAAILYVCLGVIVGARAGIHFARENRYSLFYDRKDFGAVAVLSAIFWPPVLAVWCGGQLFQAVGALCERAARW